MRSADEVLDYWFGEPAATEDEAIEKVKRWFRGGDALDREVVARFGPTIEAAMGGQLDGWADSARGRLALVILLDQLTRNAYRGQPRMYAADPRAQRLALESFSDGTAEKLGYIERMFLMMPLLHAEDLALQHRALEISQALAGEVPDLYRRVQAMNQEQTRKYAAIIGRFGRFPHRNQILGRESTSEEIDFLADWAEHGPPSGARA